MTSFDTAIALSPLGGKGSGLLFSWQVPDGWQQGRGAWGGLAIGAMTRAVELSESDPQRSVRTVSLQLCAPAMVGAHVVQVQPVRLGSGMSTWSVTVTDAAETTVATGSIITGAARASSIGRDERAWSAVSAPTAPAAPDVTVVDTPPPFPTFTQHLAFAPVAGYPLAGIPAQTLGWIDYRSPVIPSAASLLALVDGWYTATLVSLTELVNIATVNFTATLLMDPSEIVTGEPLLHHGIVSASRDGFASEQRRLWTADGRLAVDNLQTMAVG
ncbi:MAG: thioesterase family protein [Candidatus Nanopelagicales bacterium]|nr:thioesterase family protein [Candidatus Nanopelagicales bacterium]